MILIFRWKHCRYHTMHVGPCRPLIANLHRLLKDRKVTLLKTRNGLSVQNIGKPENHTVVTTEPHTRPGQIRQWPRCASRDSTNQNASFVEWFSRLERAVFSGRCGEIFALFQACVGNFDTISPCKVVGSLNLDSSRVTFKYFAFLSFCDTFELLGHVQAAMMIWVLFLQFFLDSLLVIVSSLIELFWPSWYFNLSSLQISGSTRVYPC